MRIFIFETCNLSMSLFIEKTLFAIFQFFFKFRILPSCDHNLPSFIVELMVQERIEDKEKQTGCDTRSQTQP